MKKKYILQSGLIGKFRNGTTFVSSYLAGIGHIVTTDFGEVKQVAGNWDEKTLIDTHHDEDSPLDILYLWKPTKLEQLFSCLRDPNDPLFKTAPIWKSKQIEVDSSESQSAPVGSIEGPTIRTSISIQINGKDVDLNNLSNNEKVVLISLGLI